MVCSPDPYDYYLAADGDRIGRTLESLILQSDDAAIKNYSETFANHLQFLILEVPKLGGEAIFAGGDSLLAKFRTLEDARRMAKCVNSADFTFGVGIGRGRVNAYLALKLAKCNGTGLIFEHGIGEAN